LFGADAVGGAAVLGPDGVAPAGGETAAPGEGVAATPLAGAESLTDAGGGAVGEGPVGEVGAVGASTGASGAMATPRCPQPASVRGMANSPAMKPAASVLVAMFGTVVRPP